MAPPLCEIQTLWDLLKHTEDKEERKAFLIEIDRKIMRLDLMKRRSFSVQSVRSYGQRLARRLWRLRRRG